MIDALSCLTSIHGESRVPSRVRSCAWPVFKLNATIPLLRKPMTFFIRLLMLVSVLLGSFSHAKAASSPFGGPLDLDRGALELVVIANEVGRASGTILFQLTPSTAIFALVFSTVLGSLAGVAPAWNAAHLDPVDALRYE